MNKALIPILGITLVDVLGFTMLIPMRHYVEIMRGCLLKGAGIQDLATQMSALAVLGVVILGISVVRFRKQLT